MEIKKKTAESTISSWRNQRRYESIKEQGSESKRDQANKSIGWMPWHQEPKKDVANYEKPW
jgi:hypothetical protein